MDERITFDWDGIEIAGILDIPDASNGPIPAFVILHGFGANKDSGSVPAMAKLLTNRGYASLRLDMPGVGDSGGVVGKLVCLEQVARLFRISGRNRQRPHWRRRCQLRSRSLHLYRRRR
jgi:pimeloyl-ACP methyl ester carboxylesterase